jgi:hypothetical protein
MMVMQQTLITGERMPIRLGDAPVGTVVRPPRAAYLTANALCMEYKHKYVITGKQGAGSGPASLKSSGEFTWLARKGDSLPEEMDANFMLTGKRVLGIYQVRDGEFFLTDEDEAPPPLAPKLGALPEGQKRTRGGDHYSFEFDDPDITLDDLPRQAQVVARILKDTGKSEFSADEVRELLEKNKEEIGTKQDPFKIFEFYRSKYMQKGYLNRS